MAPDEAPQPQATWQVSIFAESARPVVRMVIDGLVMVVPPAATVAVASPTGTPLVPAAITVHVAPRAVSARCTSMSTSTWVSLVAWNECTCALTGLVALRMPAQSVQPSSNAASTRINASPSGLRMRERGYLARMRAASTEVLTASILAVVPRRLAGAPGRRSASEVVMGQNWRMPAPTSAPKAPPQLRLLHVHAHPDDESSKGAATTAKYVAEGVRVMVATCTGGERGDVLNPKMDRPEVWANIGEIRRAEMDAAREILGIEQRWLGWLDSGLPEGDPLPPLPEGCFALMDVDEAAVPLVRIIRDFRPQVVTTYDENGGYPHPDHIMCHKVTMRAVELAADADALPECGPVWQVAKVYYQMGFHRLRFAALDAAMHEQGMDSPYRERLASWEDHAFEKRITTFVPCGEYFDVRDAALKAHATQIDPDGPWFAVPTSTQRMAWPTEDYELARSTVSTDIPESDLFAGLRGDDHPMGEGWQI